MPQTVNVAPELAAADLGGAARERPLQPAPLRRLRRWQRFILSPASLFVSDVVAIAVGFAAAYALRFILQFPAAQEIHSARAYAGFLAVATPIFLMAFAAYGLYEPRNLFSIVEQLFRLVTAVLVGLVATVAVSSFAIRGWPDYSRLLLFYLWVGCTVAACAGRYAWVLWRDRLASQGVAVRAVLIVGAGEAGQRVARHFAQTSQLGYRVVGFLDDTLSPGEWPVADAPVVGRLQDFDHVLARLQPDEVILADPTLSNQELLGIVNRCEGQPVAIRIFPDVFQMLFSEAAVVNLHGLTLVGIRATELDWWERTLKRWFDLVFSLAVLIVSSPIMLLIALLVKLDSPGPVFHVQERVGQDGKRFHMIKFRSMIQDAEATTGRFWTVPDDPRRTRVGSWLRRFSLDEWPNFINVLIGDMSVVGPRAERPMFVAQFSERVPDYLKRLRVKAGVTGWAQVNGLRGDVPIEERTKYDLYYVDNWSLWLDIKIIVRTVLRIIRDPAAY
ncbi:MAG TPA: undecaprenyl-phosphate glucose phosphotransferase [Chloroflexota bacterium]|nr:undecaprenyl-phosphate glucose phosphotransferase [Chloroflexota bacterium]